MQWASRPEWGKLGLIGFSDEALLAHRQIWVDPDAARAARVTGRHVPKKQNGMNDQKRQANQMQGRQAYVTQDTWNSIPKDDQVKWDSLSDKTKLTVTAYHSNKGKEHALRDAEANKTDGGQTT